MWPPPLVSCAGTSFAPLRSATKIFAAGAWAAHLRSANELSGSVGGVRYQADATVEKQPSVHGTSQRNVVGAATVDAAVRGHDGVIRAGGLAHTPDARPQMLGDAARALIAGMPRASVRRLLVVGGAGRLEVRPGVQLVDTPEFPAAWRPVALAHRDALALYHAAPPGLDWTYFSPAAVIEPGK